MALDLFKEHGTPLDKQQFDWRDLVREPISKLDDDAFTRVRVILLNGIENEAWIFQHQLARMSESLRIPLARVRRSEQHQQTLVNWLLPPDQSVLETTIAYEQVAVEVTASLAQNELDPYVKQALDFGLLEDFDHLYRYSALLDRLEGKDANNILQSYTDAAPGRPTIEQHRDPFDDLREHYDHRTAAPITKINALTITAAEQQTRNYYATVGNVYADPIARQLYAEISSIEEQHVTQYESLIDPHETGLEKWLLHEATEVYNYLGAMQQESNKRIKAIWERFVDYELGHLHFVMDLFRRIEHRDPAEVLPQTLPETISFKSQRDYVRNILATQVDLRPVGSTYVNRNEVPEDAASIRYRQIVNRAGSPSELVSAGYQFIPGTDLLERARVLRKGDGSQARIQP